MNLNIYNTTNYENIANWTLGENKPNSNPIKPNFQNAKMNANAFSQKDYENETTLRPKKTNPKQTQFPKSQKMNANAFSQKDYENETTRRPKKTNPKQTQFQRKKNAPAPLRSRCVEQEIFEKLLICTCFYSIIVLFYTICTEGHICRSNMRKA